MKCYVEAQLQYRFCVFVERDWGIVWNFLGDCVKTI